MKFYGRVLSSTRKNWLNCGGDLGIVRWVNEQKNTVIVVAYPDRGAGNDPETFFFFFGGGGGGGEGSLSQPRLNIFTMGNMRVMICLGQGGLRSLSASSWSVGSSVLVVSRWLWPGNRTLLEKASMVVTWWIVACLFSVLFMTNMYYQWTVFKDTLSRTFLHNLHYPLNIHQSCLCFCLGENKVGLRSLRWTWRLKEMVI